MLIAHLCGRIAGPRALEQAAYRVRTADTDIVLSWILILILSLIPAEFAVLRRKCQSIDLGHRSVRITSLTMFADFHSSGRAESINGPIYARTVDT